jgi:predicted nicotinamide N-methyase
MFSIDAFQRQYQTELRESVIRKHPFRFLVPQSLEQFVDPEDLFHQFPLWTKIWEASLVLAHRLAAEPPVAGQQWLELGAGLGVVGIVAAVFQHDITITEYDAHALNFIRANAHLNQCPQNRIQQLDWLQPALTRRFDRIVGSELIYNDKDFPALKRLFKSLLKPDGEILLASEVRQTNRVFLDLMRADFHIEITRNTLRSDEGSVAILVLRMRPKNKKTVS